MAEQRIIFRGSKEELRRAIRAIPSAIAGTGPDPLRLREGVASRLAFVFFSNVLQDFNRKSKGGEGDDGKKWPPNTRQYLAYQKGRFKNRNTGTSYRAGREKHLSAAQRRIWAKENRAAIKRITAKANAEGITITRQKVKAMAAPIAWAATRGTGASSLIKFYPGQPDTVLVDKGDLRRSVRPGILTAQTYSVSDPSQIFEIEAKDVVVGSRDPKAAFHHNATKQFHGDGQKGTVQRRLWPAVLPDTWVKEMTDELVTLFLRLPGLIVGRAGK